MMLISSSNARSRIPGEAVIERRQQLRPPVVLLGMLLTLACTDSEAQRINVGPLPPQAYALRPDRMKETPEGDPWAVQLDMLEDPAYVRPPLRFEFPPRLKELWLEALVQPDHDAQRLAADCFSKAQRLGLEAPEAVAPLARLLKETTQRAVAVAAARALVALDARQHAELLWEQAERRGLDVAAIVEPALAAWDYQPVRQVWLQRVTQPWREVDSARARRAAEQLGRIQEPAALDALVQLVKTGDAPPPLRLTAARALAGMHQIGGRDVAGALLQFQEQEVALVCAAELLQQRDDDQARMWLTALVRSPSPTAAALAYARLLAIDPSTTLTLAESARQSLDAQLRTLSVQTYQFAASPQAVSSLSTLLPDPHAGVRHRARDALIDLGRRDSLKEPVLQVCQRHLDQEDWRAIEQACSIVAALDHRPAIARLVELQRHPSAHAFVTAAWALKKLRPVEVLDQLLPIAEDLHARIAKVQGPEYVRLNSQFCQLAEIFGNHRYKPAVPLLLQLVPKMTPPSEWARSASVWALGHIFAGQGEEQPELVQQMIGRFIDVNASPAEMDSVRTACAAALGRMKATAAVGELQKFAPLDNINSPVGQAAYWALEKITGQPIPPVTDIVLDHANWFLEPVGR